MHSDINITNTLKHQTAYQAWDIINNNVIGLASHDVRLSLFRPVWNKMADITINIEFGLKLTIINLP